MKIDATRLTAAALLAAGTVIVGILSFTLPAIAEAPIATHSIIIRAKDKATVSRSEVTLADIAQIEGRSLRDDDAVVALERIVLAKSLQPGVSVTLSAEQILTQLRAENVDFSTVGYQLPRLVSVSRAGRKIQSEEIRAAVSDFLAMMKRDAAVDSVRVAKDVIVPISDTEYKVEPLSPVQGGSQQFTVRALNDKSEVARFNVTADLTEWRDVPVANRPLSKGSTVSEQDFLRARVNLSSVPRDATYEEEDIVGLQLTQDVLPGQVFRKTALLTPPLIQAGEQITMRYQSGALLATARGLALEAGIAGQSIRVKNAASKKVIAGIVRADKSVEVMP